MARHAGRGAAAGAGGPAGADVRLRRGPDGHGPRAALRDAVAADLNSIRRINAFIPGEGAAGPDDFCVIGTATISPQNRARLRRRLSRFRSSRDPRVGVRRALVCVLERRL